MEEGGIFEAGAALYSPGSMHSNDDEQRRRTWVHDIEGRAADGGRMDDDAYKKRGGRGKKRRELEAQLGID